jgi:hypothetical protein
MSPVAELPPHRPGSARRALLLVGVTLLLPTLAVCAVALGVAGCFRLSADARSLRQGWEDAAGEEWRPHINLNLGRATFAAVRGALAFAPLEPEARAAVASLREVEVGIYEAPTDEVAQDGATLLELADRAWIAKGWERVVGVLHDDHCVGVYLPAAPLTTKRVNCCIVVFNGQRLFVVRATANLKPILKFLGKQPDVRGLLPSWGVT